MTLSTLRRSTDSVELGKALASLRFSAEGNPMPPLFRFDFAISFAGEQREVARDLAGRLESLGYAVFFDENFEHEILGENGVDYFSRTFGREARFVIVLCSTEYERKPWTLMEREVLQARHLTESGFLIPVVLDEVKPAWLPASRVFFNLPTRTMDALVSVLSRKAGGTSVSEQQPQRSARRAWSKQVGRGTWKTKPVSYGNTLLVPVAGSLWNQPDPGDGVVCVSIDSGDRLWSVKTNSDANALAVEGDRAFVGTDGGRLFCLDIKNGGALWDVDLGEPVLAKPLVLPVGVLCFGAEGAAVLFDRDTGKRVGVGGVPGGVVADPILHRDQVYVATRTGWLLALSAASPFPVWRGPTTSNAVALLYANQFSLGGKAACSFHATPTIWGNFLLLPHVRDTTHPGLPVLAVDAQSLRVIWEGTSAGEGKQNDFGNVRATPVVVSGVAVLPVAYSNEVVAIDRGGAIVWRTPCGRAFFPHWGTPASTRDVLLVPRYDGLLHALDARTGARLWSMSLGDEVACGQIFGPHESLPGEDAYPEWTNTRSAPLNSPVVVLDKRAFVLDAAGFLHAVDVA